MTFKDNYGLINEDNDFHKHERDDDDLHIRLGAERLAFQYSSLLPQVHLTLISILQGIALGILIEQLIQQLYSRSIDLMVLPFYIASIVIIALIWQQYALAFIAFLWPFWGYHILLQFVFAAFEVFAFAAISKPAIWVLGIAGTAFTGSIIRKMNTKIVIPDNYERIEDYYSDLSIENGAAKQLFLTGLGLLIGGVLMLVMTEYQINGFRLFTFAVGIIVTVVAVILLNLTDKDIKTQFEIAFENSPWQFKNHQVIKREDSLG